MRNYPTFTKTYFDKKKGVYVSKARTQYAGKPVEAFAKCDPIDTYDAEFGEKLACKRLDLKIEQKRARSIRRYVKNIDENIRYTEEYLKRIKKAREKAIIRLGNMRVSMADMEHEILEMIDGKTN